MTSPRYNRFIHDVITSTGWTEIMTISQIYYPKLVRYFYCNLDIDQNEEGYTLVSRVKGVDITLDTVIMSEILQCPVVENFRYVASDEALVNELEDVAGFYQTITENRIAGGGVIKNELKRHLRPLHLFLAHNVAPQKGHYDAVSPLHCLILHSLETRTRIDLGYLVLREMGSTLQDINKALPFGSLLTKVFLAYGVSLDGEQTLPNTPGPITDYMFTRGGLRDIVDLPPQVQEEQGQQDEHMAQQEQMEHPQQEQMEQPQAGGDFSQQMLARFDAMQASQNQMFTEFQNFAINQNNQFARMDRRFDRMEHRMDHTTQAQQHYFDHYHQQYPDFVPYPPYHPPSPPQ